MAWLREVPRGHIRDLTREAIGAVNLSPLLGRKLKSVSGGVLQRAGIRCSSGVRPNTILLDELTAGLDPEQRLDFRTLIRDWAADRLVVISTHLVEDISVLCNTVIVVSDGIVKYQGTPDGLIRLSADSSSGDSPLERGYISSLAAGPRGDK